METLYQQNVLADTLRPPCLIDHLVVGVGLCLVTYPRVYPSFLSTQTLAVNVTGFPMRRTRAVKTTAIKIYNLSCKRKIPTSSFQVPDAPILGTYSSKKNELARYLLPPQNHEVSSKKTLQIMIDTTAYIIIDDDVRPFAPLSLSSTGAR